MADTKVADLLEFIGYALTPDDAVQLLKICDNNLEQAAMKYYETDPANMRKLLTDAKPQWDNTAFGAGRYGENDGNGGIPSFENYPHSNSQSRAPTRPPSRTSQRSNLSTHLGDNPMQSIENLQESGVVGNTHSVFGPATKDHYDTAQWAMVPTATEVIPDPAPSERQRKQGQPGFLKPSPRFNYLPALISILHTIPLFRDFLLASSVTQRSYWMGDDWWKGSPAIPARIIDTTTGLEEAHGLDILHETQRLMAFLDKSDRAYATVTSMLELDGWKESRPPMEDDDDDLLKFLMLWSAAYDAQVPDEPLDGWVRSVVNVGERSVQNFVFDGTIIREGANPGLSVYDVLDENLFSSATGSAHITDISKVLLLRLTSATTNAQGLGCRVPATLYADRYLQVNKPVIDSMYHDMKQHEDQLKHIDTTVQSLKFHTPKNEKIKPVETLKLIETSMKAFQPREGHEDTDTQDAAVLAQLQSLHQSIESKLAGLDAQSKRIRETLSSISGRFKPVVDDGAETLIDITDTEYPEGQSPQDAMHNPYNLCGVATHLGVVYLQHPDTTSNTPGAQQWWRVQYDTEPSSPTIRRDCLTQEEVLERAATESASALLVYAHKDAMAPDPLPLPKPLEDFVKKDNLNFMEELQKAATGWEHMEYDQSGDVPKGDWNDTIDGPPGYNYDEDWANMSAQEFHSHNRHDSNLSSATLTPNTEHDDTGGGTGVQEMVEVNGSMDAMNGLSSATSSTIDGGVMGIDGAVKGHGRASFTDEVMPDAHDEPRVQHIEIAEKKGG
ncbi:hypothetical protein EK21DRAFT_90659 [Setomelanomma holmii]|uniref:UBA domain-containing protein n=1 Tax=Setomelanomma holmii TaxID=210430 RepID=A0A9P4H546_9PLEO|nr:hypothetical protein EK21DRAFT_90659 [Setomelanomma holmii]